MNLRITDLTDIEDDFTPEPELPPTIKVKDLTGSGRIESLMRDVSESLSPNESGAILMNVVRYLSYSQIDLFTNCKLAYHKRYREKKKPKKHPAARVGTLVHAVLERIYKWALAKQYVGKFPGDHAFDLLRTVWKDPVNGLAGEKHEYWQDAAIMLRNYIQENPIIDSSKILGIEMGSEEDEEGKLIPFEIVPGVPFVVKKDKVEKIDDETVRVTDYKSDRQLRWQSEVDQDLQLSIYEISVRLMFPWVKRVELELYMLRHGVSQKSRERTPEELDDVRAFIKETADSISRETEWAPSLNKWCHHCAHKQECVAYQDALRGGADEHAMLAQDLVQLGRNPDRMAKLRDELEFRGKAIDKRLKAIDSAMKAMMETIPGGEILTDEKQYSIAIVNSKEYPRLETVQTIAKATGAPEGLVDAEICVVDKDRLRSVLDKLKRGRTPKQIFGTDFEYASANKVMSGPFLELLKTDLDNLTKKKPNAFVMGKARTRGFAANYRAKNRDAEEAAKTASLPDGLVESVSTSVTVSEEVEMMEQRTIIIETDTLPLTPDVEIDTIEDAMRLWRFSEATLSDWNETTVQVDDTENVDWMDPSAAIALWEKMEPRPGAHTKRGLVHSMGVKPLPVVTRAAVAQRAPAPVTSQASVDPEIEDSKPKRTRKPVSEETRQKMRDAALRRHAKK